MNLNAEVVKKFNLNPNTLQKKGRAAYLISDLNGKKFILKLQPPCGSFLSKILRQILGGSLPFMNEYMVNTKLLDLDVGGKNINFPKMLHGSLREYILFEYIECKESNRNDQTQMISCWLEDYFIFFNSMEIAKSKGFIENFIFKVLESPLLRILKQVKKSDFPLRIKFKLYKIVAKLYFQQSKLKPVFLHNDLSFSNLMDDFRGGLLLIDFEDAVAENKLVLADAVDILFDREELYLPIPEVDAYWKKLSSQMGMNFNELNFNIQMRVCVLRHILNSIFNPDFSGDEKEKYYKFMVEKIVDDDGFNTWFELGR